MTRLQVQLGILGALGVLIVFVYSRALQPVTIKPRQGKMNTQQEAQPAGMDSPAKPETTAWKSVRQLNRRQAQRSREIQRERARLLAWRRDPFTRGSTLGQISGLMLSGILWDPAEPLAVINGQTVQVGELIEQYEILSISHDRVSVTDGTQTFDLRMSP